MISIIMARCVGSSSGSSSSIRWRISKARVNDSRASLNAARNCGDGGRPEVGLRLIDLEFAGPDCVVGVDERLHAACGQLLRGERLLLRRRASLSGGPRTRRFRAGLLLRLLIAARPPVQQIAAPADDDDAAGDPPPHRRRAADRLPVGVRRGDRRARPVRRPPARARCPRRRSSAAGCHSATGCRRPRCGTRGPASRRPAGCRWSPGRTGYRSAPSRPPPARGR